MDQNIEVIDPDRCPFCGSDNVSESTPSRDFDGVTTESWCLACEKGVRKIFVFDRAEQL